MVLDYYSSNHDFKSTIFEEKIIRKCDITIENFKISIL